MKELILIQNELKAPKNHFNKFGNYSHRVAEDILEALKPICAKYNCLLTNDDEVKELNGVLFIQSTVTIKHHDWTHPVTAKGNAGIELNRKGMDISQSFGASSSYALKRALGNLFLLDDSKDADSTNTHNKESKPKLVINSPLFDRCKAGYIADKNNLDIILDKYDVDPLTLKALKDDK